MTNVLMLGIGLVAVMAFGTFIVFFVIACIGTTRLKRWITWTVDKGVAHQISGNNIRELLYALLAIEIFGLAYAASRLFPDMDNSGCCNSR